MNLTLVHLNGGMTSYDYKLTGLPNVGMMNVSVSREMESQDYSDSS